MALSGPATNGPGPHPIRTVDLMIDRGDSLTLQEGFQRGAGMAHRAITYCHKEFRNYGANRPKASVVR